MKTGLFFCLVLLVACRKTGDQNPVTRREKPNIILILGDDIGYEVLTCDGGQSYFTPAIDNLAKKGTRFTQCHACPNCSPTRVELLTGKYNFRNYTGWGSLNPAEKTIANMLHDAGYKTCVAGKWQLGGGDASIHAFGFDKYRVFEPFYTDNEATENLYRYKDPRLYEDGKYLPDNITSGKYADDMFTDYISNFIDDNLSDPFFVYYPLSLCHMPFSPTPDDAEYAAWDPLSNASDPHFFPSMVKYMDKKVQQVIDKVNAAGLGSNTIIIFMGDNGTPAQITSKYNGQIIQGGKSTTTIYGTHVPLIIAWPGSFSSQQISDALIDPSDFLPVLAEMAKINEPDFGILDGISFYPVLFGSTERLRDWIYCYWKPQYHDPVFKTWVQDEVYKLYDSTNQHFFFNIITDPNELSPVPYDQLNAAEVAIKNRFDSVLSTMHN
jgi:arylsulfatase A